MPYTLLPSGVEKPYPWNDARLLFSGNKGRSSFSSLLKKHGFGCSRAVYKYGARRGWDEVKRKERDDTG